LCYGSNLFSYCVCPLRFHCIDVVPFKLHIFHEDISLESAACNTVDTNLK